MAAPASARARVVGDVQPAAFLGSIEDAILHVLRTEAFAGPVLSSSDAVVNYLHAELAHRPVEQVRALYLDAKNHLLRDAKLSSGSIGEAPIYPREIMRQALEVNAAALILVHNHPSGDPSPSRADREATASVQAAAAALEIHLHDHLIIGKRGHTSFRALGLL